MMTAWPVLLTWLTLAAPPASAAPTDLAMPKIVAVDTAAALAPALTLTNGKRANDVVWVRLNAGDLRDEAVAQLKSWVASGGALWTETDLVGSFGFKFVKAGERERVGHARRACPLGVSPFMAQVDDVYFQTEANFVYLTGHPSALGLLKVVDPLVEPGRVDKLVCAELTYGEGRVLHRPRQVHQKRGQGEQFERNLMLLSAQRSNEVRLPLEALEEAYRHCVDLSQLTPTVPKAKAALLSIFEAYRLWWADHLTSTGQFDDALALLKAIAADLPNDPEVYLAVARWNEAQGLADKAAEARAKAKEGFLKLNRAVPAPEARQVRVTWPLFAQSVTEAGAAWDKPSAAGVAQVTARTAYLLGLDRYRAWNFADAEKLWLASYRYAPTWAPSAFALGLLNETRGDEPRQSNRDRLGQYKVASAWFDEAKKPAATAEFDANATLAAQAGSDAAKLQAATLATEPLDVQLAGHFIYRYDATDPGLRVAPLWNTVQRACEGAYQAVAGWGVWLEPTEVLVSTGTLVPRTLLPATLTTKQVYGASATAGRRIYLAAEAPNTDRCARHEFLHVLSNALTGGGFPPPLWCEEGVACAAEMNLQRSQQAQQNLRGRGRVLTLMQLNDPEIVYNRDTGDTALGQAELLANALLRRHGGSGYLSFLLNLGWGNSPEAAFLALTKLSQEEFLNSFLTGRL